MGLGFWTDAQISTVGSLGSNGSQHFPPEKPLINGSRVTPPRVASRRLRSHHTSRNKTTTQLRETDRHTIIKNSSGTSSISALEPGGKCTGMGEADLRSPCPRPTWLAETWSTWPRPREGWPRPERLDRDDEADYLPGRDLRRPGRDDRDQGNLADGRPIPGELGRRPTPITVNAQTKISEVNPSLRIR